MSFTFPQETNIHMNKGSREPYHSWGLYGVEQTAIAIEKMLWTNNLFCKNNNFFMQL